MMNVKGTRNRVSGTGVEKKFMGFLKAPCTFTQMF